ncbi:hypothetical protein GOBAR_AA22845 [Gossypium barbadense]|uniref:Calcineurin-like phosphoesterase domain-containing protein n=1 Tax=Gossypium barbadense TaxID=3634 RepID=A0A2P5X3C3_GOSBA|nr:hypothetical protein GOBAR_AA22845 [Gossypium barbadense]
MADPINKLRTVICVGDIHGYLTKLLNLWSNLQSQIDPDSFNTATIIFLGDYCDRGPDTRKVIEFLISLPKRYPNQKHFEAKETWKEYAENEEIEGWYKGEGYEKMHLQGRIWGGWFDVAQGIDCKGAFSDAAPTFGSLWSSHGSSVEILEGMIQVLGGNGLLDSFYVDSKLYALKKGMIVLRFMVFR